MVSVIWCGLEDVELHFGGDLTTKHEYGAKRYSSADSWPSELRLSEGNISF